MRKILMALMGMGLASGCYVGVEDQDEEYDLDRGGRRCFYSYYGGSSASYTSNSSRKSAEVAGARGFTIEVDTANNRGQLDMPPELNEIAYQALSAAPGVHMMACLEQNPDIDQACHRTCKELGLALDPGGPVVCEECVDEDGTGKCEVKDQFQAQQKERPYDGRETKYVLRDEQGLGITVSIGDVVPTENGLAAEVVVEGECGCECGW